MTFKVKGQFWKMLIFQVVQGYWIGLHRQMLLLLRPSWTTTLHLVSMSTTELGRGKEKDVKGWETLKQQTLRYSE